MSTKRLLIVYDVDGWAYHRRALALRKHKPDDYEVAICPVARFEVDRAVESDLIFCLDYSVPAMIRWRCPNVPLVVSYNRDANSRQERIGPAIDHADLAVLNNENVYRFVRQTMPYRARKCVCIANGVDTEVFRPADGAERPRRVLWTGSSNATKGKRYHELLRPLGAELERKGIEFDFRPVQSSRDRSVLTTDQMVEWYNSGSVILCASSTEGTPNTTLEGMACGCVPVSTAVGNLVEFGEPMRNCMICAPMVHDFMVGIGYSLQEFEPMSRYARASITNGGWAWSERSLYFYRLFDRIIEYGAMSVRPFSYRDVPAAELFPR